MEGFWTTVFDMKKKLLIPEKMLNNPTTECENCIYF